MMSKAIGMQDLKFAAQEKVTEEHDVIDEAIRDDAEVRRSNHNVWFSSNCDRF